MTYGKPLPVIDQETAFYWNSLSKGKFFLKKCSNCTKFHFYPRSICPHCYSDKTEWVEASGRGEIYSYTIARRPAGPAYSQDVPYIVAIVDLQEGPRMMSNIVTDRIGDVKIGTRVEVTLEAVTDEVTLPKFKIANKRRIK